MSIPAAPLARRSRIGFLIPTTKNGGAEDVVLRWAGEAARRGHEVFVYTFLPASELAEIPAAVSHVHRSFRSSVARWTSLPLWIRARANEDGLDVLVTALTHSNLVALIGLKLAGPTFTSVVISEHSLPSMLLPLDRRAVRMKLWLLRRLYRRADAAVAVSHAVAAELVSRFRVPPDRLAVVPNPVLNAPAPAALRLPQSAHVAFVGRLVRQKAPELFIETLAELARRGVAVRGTVVGDGPLREDVASAARRADLPVRFTGWRRRWQDEVPHCDCLLLPSEVEGFGNVLIEAAAAGIPSVVRSSALGVADAVIPGVTGELVASGTPEQLADGIVRAIAARPDDPVAAWLRRFTTQSSSDALLELIGRVTARKGSSAGAWSRSDADPIRRAA